ncbi:MAG: hypothetical protein IKF82_00445 [Bacilli bacterium]|nr:hypothetical protein [Bacilli bacterium]
MVYIYEVKRETYPNRTLERSLIEHTEEYSSDTFKDMIREARYKIEEYIEEYTDDKYNETMEIICDEAEENYLEAIVSYLIEYKGFRRHFVKEATSVYID